MEKGPIILNGVYDGNIIIQVMDDNIDRVRNLLVTLYGKGKELFCEGFDFGYNDSDALLYSLMFKQHVGFVTFEIDDKVVRCSGDLNFVVSGEGFKTNPQKINL
ncbi:hypothetical protein K0B04_01425 [Patescibacteria group bacterium]|nr:hypothetical protein [Patescibacteria group bacterium]